MFRRKTATKRSSEVLDIQDDEAIEDGENEFNALELNNIKQRMRVNITVVYEKKTVTDAWKKTFHLRQKDLRQSDTNTAFLTEWPAFKEAFGFKLVWKDTM